MAFLKDIDIETLWPYNWPKVYTLWYERHRLNFDGFLKYLPSKYYSIFTYIAYLIIFQVFYRNNTKLFFWLQTTSMSDFGYFKSSKKVYQVRYKRHRLNFGGFFFRYFPSKNYNVHILQTKSFFRYFIKTTQSYSFDNIPHQCLI